MAKYEVNIYYKKESNKPKNELKEVVVCADMMEATLLRMKKEKEEMVEKVVIMPYSHNDFPFGAEDSHLFD